VKAVMTYSVSVFVMLGVANARAQASSGAAAPAASISTASSARAIRAENRKLRGAVLFRLSRTKGLVADGIVVIAKGGVVTLEGYVPDAGQIDLATSVAKLVNGVSEVRNSLILQANAR
jgi:hyperosmotically inducible protein